MSTFEGWLKIVRISNTPTIVSNIMVAMAICNQYGRQSGVDIPIATAVHTWLTIMVALLLVYLGGMVLNDASDAVRDQTLCPDRPIPQGVIDVRHAWMAGGFMLIIPLALGAMIRWDLFIAIAILDLVVLAYTCTHRWALPAVVLMGICRGLVYLVPITAFIHITSTQAYAIPLAIAIAAYTALLTSIGRFEYRSMPRLTWMMIAIVLPALVPAMVYGATTPLVWLTFIAYVIWIIRAWMAFLPRRNHIVDGMHALLAGFCLLDCVLVASLGGSVLVAVSACCFLLTLILQRKVQGT